jgi:ferredoxin
MLTWKDNKWVCSCKVCLAGAKSTYEYQEDDRVAFGSASHEETLEWERREEEYLQERQDLRW